MKQHLSFGQNHFQLFLFITLVLVFLWPVWAILFDKWSLPDDPLSHGWLIACLFFIQLFIVAPTLARPVHPPSFMLMALLLLFSTSAMLAALLSVETVATALLPPVLLFALLLHFGPQNIRKLWFPVLYLYFAIPVWEPLTATLQWVTTIINGKLLATSGIAVSIIGNTIQIPAGTFEVAGGCSGIKYFITSLSLSTLYAHWYLRNTRKKITLIALSVLLALFTNWIRVYVIILVGSYTNMQHPLIHDHENFGWILYAISLIPFFLVIRAFGEDPPQNIHQETTGATTIPPTHCLWIAGILALPISFWIIITSVTQNIPQPSHYPGFRSASTSEPPLIPVIYDYFSKTSAVKQSTGHKQTIWLVNYYFDAPWRNELADYRNDLFPSPWQLTDQTSENHFTDITRTVILSHPAQGKQLAVLYWYEVDNEMTASSHWAKALQLSKAPHGKGSAALRMLMTYCRADCTRESASLKNLATTIGKIERQPSHY